MSSFDTASFSKRPPTFSIRYALISVSPKKNIEVRNRFEQLSNMLWERTGLLLRDDSRLAWSFITHTLPRGWSLYRVVDELALTHYLHNYTQYKQIVRCVLPVIKSTLDSNPSVGPLNSWEYIQRFIIPRYRMEAMMSAHPDGIFPMVWPWMLKSGPPSSSSSFSSSDTDDDITDYEDDDDEYDTDDGDDDSDSSSVSSDTVIADYNDDLILYFHEARPAEGTVWQ